MNKNNLVIIDSCVWVSYYLQSDTNHQKAVEEITSYYKNQTNIYVTRTILLETINVLAREKCPLEILVKAFFDLSEFTEYSNLDIAIAALDLCQLITLKSNDFIILLETLEKKPKIFKTYDARLNKAYHLTKDLT